VAQAVKVQFGKYEVKGPALWGVRLVLAAAIAAVIYFFPPRSYRPMWLSALGWVAFSVYWGAAARNSAGTKTSESAESRRAHVMMTNIGQVLLFLAVPGLRTVFLPPSPVWVPLGLGVQAASIALAVWARHHLGRNWSGRIEIKVDHELVRSGPYRKLRHPIYTAVIGMCAGTALVSGRTHALLGVLLVLAAYWRKVHMEEDNLRTAFGDRYDDYRRDTWGAVPGFF